MSSMREQTFRQQILRPTLSSQRWGLITPFAYQNISKPAK